MDLSPSVSNLDLKNSLNEYKIKLTSENPSPVPIFGILNHKNNCYINCILQALNATEPFKLEIKKVFSPEEIFQPIYHPNQSTSPLSLEFSRFFEGPPTGIQTRNHFPIRDPKSLVKELTKKFLKFIYFF